MMTKRILTVIDIPDLGHQRRRGQLVMSAQVFGLRAIESGEADARDMPSDVAYHRAASFALVLLDYMEREEPLSMDLLVNLLADRIQLAQALGPSTRKRADS